MDAYPNSIVIDGVSYVPAKDVVNHAESPIKIVILQRGNVMIGRFSQEDELCSLDDASVIRVWGTKKGLGELALEGKKNNTVLDYCGHVEFHVLAMIASISCDESKW